MIRNVKVLGLLALAVLAMSVVFASSAQAQNGVFTAGATPETHTATVLHGEQYGLNNHIVANGTVTVCENPGVTLAGTDADGTAKTLTITPTYKDCLTGGLPATTKTNGCDYIFTQPTKISSSEYTGWVDLTCPAGKKLEIEVFSGGGVTSHSGFRVCTITIYPKGGAHEQELGGHVTYTPAVKDGKDDITARLAVEGITAVQEGLCGAKHDENAKYTSAITLTAKSHAGAPHDLWISEE